MLPFGLIKMLMNVDFGDSGTHFAISLFLIAIAYFAWRSTNIREQPHYHTVLLLERRLRRRSNRSRLSTHIQSTSIVTGVQTEATGGTASGDSQAIDSNQPSETNKPPEANTSSSGSADQNTQNSETIHTDTNNIEEREFETIVEIMDADANEVRRRRLAYYENRQQGASVNRAGSSNEPSTISTNESIVEQLDNPSNEPIMEHNYAEHEMVDNIEIEPKYHNTSKDSTESDNAASSNAIRIKLKYLNDELKLVDGRLEEQLGDFKRRHFHLEFSSNKLVRLIFNGQVLQPDSETLQSCGLFDNCVVHCLIHQQRNAPTDGNNGNATTGSSSNTSYLNNNNNNQGRDWDLGNILFALVSLILTSAWYFRYEYAHLYNVTATIALVAITGIFTIFLVGVYFPDYEQQRVPRQ